MVREAGIKKDTMHDIVRKDFGLSSFHLEKRQDLSDTTVGRRLARAK